MKILCMSHKAPSGPRAFHMTMQSIHHAVGYSCMAIMFSIDCGPTHLSLNGQTGDAAISMRDGGNTTDGSVCLDLKGVKAATADE